MPIFNYKAKQDNGDIIEGSMMAPKEYEAINRLKGKKLTVVEITLAPPNLGDKFMTAIGMGPSVTSKDLVLFSRQLSTLVSAGVPIVQSLTILEEQQENPFFQDILGEIRSDIESGLSISDALKKYEISVLAVSGASEPCDALRSMSVPKSPRTVPGAASFEFVGPMRSRHRPIAPSASNTSATHGPDVMKSTSSP